MNNAIYQQIGVDGVKRSRIKESLNLRDRKKKKLSVCEPLRMPRSYRRINEVGSIVRTKFKGCGEIPSEREVRAKNENTVLENNTRSGRKRNLRAVAFWQAYCSVARNAAELYA